MRFFYHDDDPGETVGPYLILVIGAMVLLASFRWAERTFMPVLPVMLCSLTFGVGCALFIYSAVPSLSWSKKRRIDIFYHFFLFAILFFSGIHAINYFGARESTEYIMQGTVRYKNMGSNIRRKSYSIHLFFPDGRDASLHVSSSRYNRIKEGDVIPVVFREGLLGYDVIVKD